MNYLKVLGGGVGLIVNFGRRADFKRLMMGNPEVSLPMLPQNRADP